MGGAVLIVAFNSGVLVSTPVAAAEYSWEAPDGDGYSWARFLIYVPEQQEEVRGILVCAIAINGDGTGLAKSPTLRRYANSMGCAIIGCALGGGYRHAERGSGAALGAAIRFFAQESLRPELNSVPLILYGTDMGAQFMWNFAGWQPDRVAAVALLNCSGYDSTNERDARQVPILMLHGASVPASRQRDLVRLFNAARVRGAPWALIFSDGAEPEAFARSWLTAAQELRAPASAQGQSAGLKKIGERDGWIGDPGSMQIKPAAQADRADLRWLWLPDEDFAKKLKPYLESAGGAAEPE